MRFTTTRELQDLDKYATTPQKLQTELFRLVASSKKIVPKVELCNEKSGDYCIKLEGTLDTVP